MPYLGSDRACARTQIIALYHRIISIERAMDNAQGDLAKYPGVDGKRAAQQLREAAAALRLCGADVRRLAADVARKVT